MNVRTKRINPPIGTTQFDWSAWIDGEEESGIVGHGATEIESLKNLCERLFDAFQCK